MAQIQTQKRVEWFVLIYFKVIQAVGRAVGRALPWFLGAVAPRCRGAVRIGFQSVAKKKIPCPRTPPRESCAQAMRVTETRKRTWGSDAIITQ